MSDLCAIIGGSGLYQLDENFLVESAEKRDTPYGPISAELEIGHWHGHQVAFLPRHGRSHTLPPHIINYRANLWALKHMGVSHVIAINAVGGIRGDYGPLAIGLPDQIIDYTTGRAHSFFDGNSHDLKHIDFTWPYSKSLRSSIKRAAEKEGIDLVGTGTYGCTNGPRLETAAEIRKMKADGCDVIGMTGMPEAALARELNLEYASVVLVVNWCAGLDDSEISMDEIRKVLQQGIDSVRKLILVTLKESNA